MARHEMLNNVTHKDLRVITRHAAEFGDNLGSVLTFPTEYGDIQREYPIFFRKDPQTGEFGSVALLGFAKDENLFLDETGWHARYIPGVIARGPFLIGFQQQQVNGETQTAPVIHV
ncbi:MAG TPA: SapC family protein, partial [Gammaproteobacteria bacterium]|nr:SapC family protein [Gammaproteobacteria bacterium]